MESDSLLMVPLNPKTPASTYIDTQAPPTDSEDERSKDEHAAMLPQTNPPQISVRSGSDAGSTHSVDVSMPRDCAPANQGPPSTCASRTSLASATADVCRICHCESEPNSPLIAPCACAGSLKYVHQSCLQQWIKSADTKSCELCKFQYEMTTKVKPFRKWTKLDMSVVERRKIMCSVTFHVIAITCVIWSLYVLIDRTTEELSNNELHWPFWTKLIVVAIGFTGGLVFMYVQCKMYVQLCRRWRAYNRVIHIENAPDKKVRPPDLPLTVKTLKTDV